MTIIKREEGSVGAVVLWMCAEAEVNWIGGSQWVGGTRCPPLQSGRCHPSDAGAPAGFG